MVGLVWTLESCYHVARAEVRGKVLAILNTPGLEVFEGELILRTMVWYAEKNVDFIDAYSAAWLAEQAIALVYTFDCKHLARLLAITTVVPGHDAE